MFTAVLAVHGAVPEASRETWASPTAALWDAVAATTAFSLGVLTTS